PEAPRRAGRSGCLGGLIYFAFVVSISIILACVGWMAASDVLALNKEAYGKMFLDRKGCGRRWIEALKERGYGWRLRVVCDWQQK
ncbi:hypothetical protein LEA_13203, partial [human gut metagenome]